MMWQILELLALSFKMRSSDQPLKKRWRASDCFWQVVTQIFVIKTSQSNRFLRKKWKFLRAEQRFYFLWILWIKTWALTRAQGGHLSKEVPFVIWTLQNRRLDIRTITNTKQNALRGRKSRPNKKTNEWIYCGEKGTVT